MFFGKTTGRFRRASYDKRSLPSSRHGASDRTLRSQMLSARPYADRDSGELLLLLALYREPVRRELFRLLKRRANRPRRRRRTTIAAKSDDPRSNRAQQELTPIHHASLPFEDPTCRAVELKPEHGIPGSSNDAINEMTFTDA